MQGCVRKTLTGHLLRRRTNTARHHQTKTTTTPPPPPAPSPTEQVSDVFSSVVPNTGSTARDHLANERTFLAWARTGLTFVGLGVAIDSLVRVSKHMEEETTAANECAVAKEDRWKAHAPATGLVLTGGAVLTFSTFRYYRVQRCLMQGTFPLNRVGLGAVIASTSLLTLASLMMTFSDEIIDTSTFISVPLLGLKKKGTSADVKQ